jgi:hypothetical protein
MFAAVTTLLVLAAAGGALAGAEPTGERAGAGDEKLAGKVYGAGVSAGDTVLVSDLLAHAEKYVGATVRVEGPVVGCCAKRGCWIEVASNKEFEKILVKVEDGEIVFPMALIGETVRVEGTFEGVPMDYEHACAYMENEASCQGQTFDKSQVPAEGITFYRIKGTGAVVQRTAG